MKNILIILAIFCLTFSTCYKNQHKKHQLSVESEAGEEEEQPSPILNFHIEEPDSEPTDLRRMDEESRSQRERIRALEDKEEMDKQAFQQIIEAQNEQISKLSKLAKYTAELAAGNALAKETRRRRKFRFLRK